MGPICEFSNSHTTLVTGDTAREIEVYQIGVKIPGSKKRGRNLV